MPLPPFQIHATPAPFIALTLSLAFLPTCPLTARSKAPAEPMPVSVPANLTVTLAAGFAEGGPAPSNAVAPALSDGEKQAPTGVAGSPLLVTTLHNIVVQQKAGPWRRRSYWHEYVISLAPRGGIPLVIEAATLINARGEPVAPGDNPWVLANASKSWMERTDARGKTSPGRIAASSVAVGALWPVGASPFLGCLSWGAYGVGAAIIAPVYAAKAVAFNAQGRKQIEANFQKHRLVLPLTITSGQVVQGSLFFPVTLGPQRLVLHGRLDTKSVEIAIDLTSLMGLLLTPAAGAPSPATGPPQQRPPTSPPDTASNTNNP